MYIMWYIVTSMLGLAVDILLIFMLITAVMSWIAPMMDHPVMNFIREITELLVRPVRKLLMRFELVRSCPLDISFYLTSFLLVLLSNLLDRR